MCSFSHHLTVRCFDVKNVMTLVFTLANDKSCSMLLPTSFCTVGIHRLAGSVLIADMKHDFTYCVFVSSWY